jgi:Ca2+-binding EF-hand superfamily protein
MMTFDTDGDGIISDEEREVARQRREELVRARVDTDGDGQVSEAERAAARRDRAGRVHASLDRDGDGRVTPDELGATDARGLDVQVADTDGDGALSVAELETVWAERRARRFELRRQRAAGSGAPGAPSAHDAPTSPP